MKRIKILLLILSVSGFTAKSQVDINPGEFMAMLSGNMNSDRPGQAITPFTAGILAFQIQTGVNYDKFRIPDYNERGISSFTTVRLGLTTKFELNTSFEYDNVQIIGFAGIPFIAKGFKSPDIGFRYMIYRGKQWVPTVALQSNLSFKSNKGDFTQSRIGSSFYIATSNELGRLSITSNVGMRYSGDGLQEPEFLYALNLGVTISSKLSAFIEGFGSISDEKLYGDMGFAYRPMSYLQFDVLGGWMGGLDFDVPDWFVEAGVTWKLSVIKMIAKKKMKKSSSIFGA